MQRAVLIVAVVTALAAAGCGSEDGPRATTSPIPFGTASPNTSVSPAATTDVVTPSPSGTGVGSTASPQNGAPTATPVPPGAPATRASTTVSCSDDPQFCSREVKMRVNGDNLTSAPAKNVTRGGSTTPNITMVSTVVAPGGDEGRVGEEVSKIHVEVSVQNTTNRTFVFASRDVSLRVERNGSSYDVLRTAGNGFEMTPDSKMLAKFDLPIIDDGTYEWAARTWFYEKT